MSEQTRRVPVTFDNDEDLPFYIEVTADEVDDEFGGVLPGSNVSGGSSRERFERVTSMVKVISSELATSFKHLEDISEAEIEFGIDFGVEAGGLFAQLVKAHTSSHMTIRLKYTIKDKE